MKSLALFSEKQDLSVRYSPHLFNASQATHYFQTLAQKISWRQDEIRMFGKKVPVPRLVAWYGDVGVRYRYSGLEWVAQGWQDDLMHIRKEVERATQANFNTVLLNFYRDGQDSMGWHADDEKELQMPTVIASVSFGAARRFLFRRKDNHREKVAVVLTSGSLLEMRDFTQKYWQHSIPKQKNIAEGRINLTFRNTLCP